MGLFCQMCHKMLRTLWDHIVFTFVEYIKLDRLSLKATRANCVHYLILYYINYIIFIILHYIIYYIYYITLYYIMLCYIISCHIFYIILYYIILYYIILRYKHIVMLPFKYSVMFNPQFLYKTKKHAALNLCN